MEWTILLAAMLSTAQANHSEAPAAPPPFAPEGKWIVHADEGMCLLERDYSSGGRKVALIFQPMLDLAEMDLYVTTDDRDARKQFVGSFNAAIESGKATATGKYLSVFSPNVKARVTRLSAQRDLLDTLADGDTLRVEAKPLNLRFTVAHPSAARAALRQCVASLKQSWGLDPASNAPVAAPIGDVASAFGTNTYPPEAVRQGVYGRVVALLTVSDAGKVNGCRVLSSAGELLNEATCRDALRIRFTPALGTDGKPVDSTFILPVNWLLPGVKK